VIRLAEMAGHTPICTGGDQESIDKLVIVKKPGLHIVKCHVYRPSNYSNLVTVFRTCYRDPVAVFASMCRMKGISLEEITDAEFDKTMNMVLDQEEVTREWELSGDCLMIDYNWMVKKPMDYIRDIAFQCDFQQHHALAVCGELNIENVRNATMDITEADSKTQLRPNHVSDQRGVSKAWRKVIPEELLKRIERGLA
jgi:hypothetical protein